MLNMCFLAIIILIASIFQISHWAGAHNVAGRWRNIFGGVSVLKGRKIRFYIYIFGMITMNLWNTF